MLSLLALARAWRAAWHVDARCADRRAERRGRASGDEDAPMEDEEDEEKDEEKNDEEEDEEDEEERGDQGDGARWAHEVGASAHTRHTHRDIPPIAVRVGAVRVVVGASAQHHTETRQRDRLRSLK